MNTEESWAKPDEVICNDKIQISDGPSGPVPLPDRAAGRLRPRRRRHPHAVGLPLRFAGGHGGALRLSRPLGRAGPFTPGTWLSDGGQYYFIDEGGATGRTASLEDGTGVGFSYTLNGAEADFAMGAADSSSPCTVSRDGDTITLEWEDGTTEHLTYVSAQGSDAFRFYSNQELADLALAYYKEQSGVQDIGNLTAAARPTRTAASPSRYMRTWATTTAPRPGTR